MIRFSTFAVVPCLVLVTSSGLSQTIDTARVRAAYAAVTALRNDHPNRRWFDICRRPWYSRR